MSLTLRRSAAPLTCVLSVCTLAAHAAEPPNFTKDVAPVLQARCQECHRPGEAAPFSLLTYEQARPWAKAIKAAVVRGKMPPWFADPHYGKFSNDRSLRKSEIDTVVAWVDAGAPNGDAKDMPPPREFANGWTIPKPDTVIELPRSYHFLRDGDLGSFLTTRASMIVREAEQIVGQDS